MSTHIPDTDRGRLLQLMGFVGIHMRRMGYKDLTFTEDEIDKLRQSPGALQVYWEPKESLWHVRELEVADEALDAGAGEYDVLTDKPIDDVRIRVDDEGDFHG